jgi:hypothetical protein
MYTLLLALAFLFLIHAVVPSLVFAMIPVVQIAFPSVQLRRAIFVGGLILLTVALTSSSRE